MQIKGGSTYNRYLGIFAGLSDNIEYKKSWKHGVYRLVPRETYKRHV